MCIFIKKGYVIIYDSFSRIAVLVNIGIPVEGDELKDLMKTLLINSWTKSQMIPCGTSTSQKFSTGG